MESQCSKYLVVFKKRKLKRNLLVGLFGRKRRNAFRNVRETWVRRANSEQELVDLIKSIKFRYKKDKPFSVKIYEYVDTINSIDNLTLLSLRGKLHRRL